MSSPLRVIQISDLHLFAVPERELLGVKTYDSFKAVIELIQREEKQLDFILLSGDLSQDGSDASYYHILHFLRPLNVPVYYVAGNHDYVSAMMHVYPRDNFVSEKQIVIRDWNFILLDSQKPGSVEGFLDKIQLDYLDYCLTQFPHHRAVILFHHHPVKMNCAWLDPIGLTNADAFWKQVSHYSNVHTVLFGHVHQESQHTVGKINCYSPPSTCIQFKRNQDQFGLEDLPQGYRWMNLYDDGRVETGVKRVEKYVGEFQKDAKGY
jgi:Icc protein